MLFKFEIIQTVDGLPDPSAYPFNQAHSPELQGAATVVLHEFEGEAVAKCHECCHDDGWKSDVWHEHCPQHFRNLDSVGGLDVCYIGPATEADIEHASGGDFWKEDATWQELMFDRQGAEFGLFEEEREREEEEQYARFEAIESAPPRHLKKRSRL